MSDPRTALRHAPLVGLLLLNGCTLYLCPQLTREDAIERGSVQGRLVEAEDDDEPISFARVHVPGAARSVRSDSQGSFVVRGLRAGSWALRLVDDPDGDGWPDRAGSQGVLVPLATHSTDPVTGLIGQGERLIAGVDLGDVPLAQTGVIEGSVFAGADGVPPVDEGLVGRVMITRELSVNVDEDGSNTLYTLDAEVIEGVDDQGRWRATGVGPGDALVVPLLYADAGGGALGPLVRVGAAKVVTVPSVESFDGEPEDAGEEVVAGPFAAPETRTARLALDISPPLDAEAYVMFVRGGAELPACEVECVPFASCGSGVDDALTAAYPSLRVVGPLEANNPLQLDAPLGDWDLRVCSGEQQGTLRGHVLAPQDDDADIARWGTIGLGAEDEACASFRLVEGSSCEGEGASCEADQVCRGTAEFTELGARVFRCFTPLVADCDGDLVSGLPLRSTDGALWDACAATCEGLRGAALLDAACVVDEQEYDCDDDGDGQADVDEPECYSRSGEDLGDDLDRDGLCGPRDPFPLCQANTAAACEAGTNDARGEGPAAAPLTLYFDPSFAGGQGEILVDATGGDIRVAAAAHDEASGTTWLAGARDEGGGVFAPRVWELVTGATDVVELALSGVTEGEVRDLAIASGELLAVGESPSSNMPAETVPALWRLPRSGSTLVAEAGLVTPTTVQAPAETTEGQALTGIRVEAAVIDQSVASGLWAVGSAVDPEGATRGLLWRANLGDGGADLVELPVGPTDTGGSAFFAAAWDENLNRLVLGGSQQVGAGEIAAVWTYEPGGDGAGGQLFAALRPSAEGRVAAVAATLHQGASRLLAAGGLAPGDGEAWAPFHFVADRAEDGWTLGAPVFLDEGEGSGDAILLGPDGSDSVIAGGLASGDLAVWTLSHEEGAAARGLFEDERGSGITGDRASSLAATEDGVLVAGTGTLGGSPIGLVLRLTDELPDQQPGMNGGDGGAFIDPSSDAGSVEPPVPDGGGERLVDGGLP